MPTKAKPKSPLQGVEWPTEPFLVAMLPLPPGINASYKTNYLSQFHASNALKQFKKDAEMTLVYSFDVMCDFNIVDAIKASKNKIPLSVDIDFYFKTLWLHDVDGCIKAAL